jgi:hypothetical protein
VFRDVTGTTLNLRTLAQLGSMLVTTVGDVVNVDGTNLLPRDGSRAMTGNLNMGGHDITSASPLAVQGYIFPVAGAVFTLPSADGAASGYVLTTNAAGLLTFQPPAGFTNVVNVGAGLGQVFRDAVGGTINLRTVAGINNIATATVGDVINVDGIALLPRDGSLPMTGNLNMGGNSITNVAGGIVTTGANVGAGTGQVFRDVTGTTINLRTLFQAGSMLVTTVGNVVNIDGTNLLPRNGSRPMLAVLDMGGFGIIDVPTIANTTGTALVTVQSVSFPNGGASYMWPAATGAANTVLTTDGSGGLSFQPIPSAPITTVANVGAGAGQVFRDITGTTINLRTLLQAGSMSVTTAGDVINVDGTNLLPRDGSRPMLAALNMNGNGIVAVPNIANGTSPLVLQHITFPGTVTTGTFTWPAADGTASGQVLTTNGAGVLSFQPIPAAPITGVANVGTGAGVFRDTTAGTINLRSIAGAGSITTAVAGDIVNVDGSALLPLNGSRAMTGALNMGGQNIANVPHLSNGASALSVNTYTFPAAGTAFTLPSAPGANGSVLTSDGAGGLTFVPSVGQTMNVAPATIAVSQTLVDPGSNHVLYKVNTSSTVTITLPVTPTANAKLTIKDFTGTGAGTNNITITPSAGQTIEGVAGNQLISTNRGAMSLIWSATDSTWIIWN